MADTTPADNRESVGTAVPAGGSGRDNNAAAQAWLVRQVGFEPTTAGL